MDQKSNKSFQLNNPKSILISGLIIIFLIALACIGGYFILRYFISQTAKDVQQTIQPQTRQEQKNEESFDKPDTKNKNIIVGKIEWNVNEVKSIKDTASSNASDKDYCSPGKGNKFIYIKYTVKNIDRLFVTVPKNFQDIYDSNQEVFKSLDKTQRCLKGDASVPEKYAPDVLRKGDSLVIESLYEVPENAKGFRLKVGDLSTVGKEYKYIALGI